MRVPFVLVLPILFLGACASMEDVENPSGVSADGGTGGTDDTLRSDAMTPEPMGGPDAGPEPDAAPPIDTTPAPAHTSRIAVGPDQGLVVWVDERGADDDIYASRVSGDGSILDLGGLPISTQSGNEAAPAVVWTGEGYIVAWMDRRDGDTRIYVRGVSVTGELSAERAVSAADDYSQFPELASGSPGTVLVYEGPCGPQCTGVVGHSLGADLTAGPAFIVQNGGREPSIAARENDFVVTFADYASGSSDVLARFVNGSGALLGDVVEVATWEGNQVAPSVASLGDTVVVSWVDALDGLHHGYRTITPVLGSPVSVAGVRWQDTTRLASRSDGFRLLWTEDGEEGTVGTFVRSLDESGGLVGTALMYAAQTGPGLGRKRPALACGATCFLAQQETVEGVSTIVGLVSGGAVATPWSTAPVPQ